MVTKAQSRARAAQLQAAFVEAGAQVVEADILQPAEVLLDLYGEDIRGRAYVTSDPLQGECMLRPDFTVPVVREHMENGATPARYTYSGKVFRKQEHDDGRASEYWQVGYELFDGTDSAAADAEVFALFSDLLAPLGLRASTGDIGILIAAVDGLQTSDARKIALKRHLWRPRRFRALMDRFGGRKPVPETRVAMLKMVAGGIDAAIEAAGPDNGLRTADEVAARVRKLQAEAEEPALSGGELDILETILSLRETSANALENLRDIAVDMPSIQPAVQRMEARLEALAARGIDAASLDFEASYGRTTLEYYDGFVFGFHAPLRPDLPPVTSGGRYDALTKVLGQGRSIPAVGGVIRPELVELLAGGQA
ncbi:ATP phosphoribosyltransferase regulatory subunit [Actibacterium pelagium]|uniref:ATP phosphoribosyltransferase regulatory subunit n=1 Tax=Actibacterium pelagium TaxID=2029103 RepID=A0A917EGE1_9RHOB|nr:ATP phosphoribosyltransferase regulatory subunit [Actibacterium pelagium]GGE37806.1 ATP phosphoribosyltransferase regulatory subunit [Actibacterium pelagium]